jgi:hypothetical protein
MVIRAEFQKSYKRIEKKFYLTKTPFQTNEMGFPINEPLVN